MAAHVPTMLVMIIVSSLMMAASMAVVGWGRRRDGLGRWAAALMVNAVGHLLIMLRGLVPDVVSIVLVTCFVIVSIDNFPARASFVGLVIGLQAVWALVAALERRHATVGRGQWLLVAGLGLEALVLGGRALLALGESQTATSILQGSLLQTLTFMATFSVVLISSMGFVFMSRDRADENNRIMAALDPLTGVANRRSLIAALDRDVSRAVRSRESIALM